VIAEATDCQDVAVPDVGERRRFRSACLGKPRSKIGVVLPTEARIEGGSE
jgi:hypothetical protein